MIHTKGNKKGIKVSLQKTKQNNQLNTKKYNKGNKGQES